jgi:hypothetical protein
MSLMSFTSGCVGCQSVKILVTVEEQVITAGIVV